MKEKAQKFLDVYLKIYNRDICQYNDQIELFDMLYSLEYEECSLFMKKYNIKEKRFPSFKKAVLSEYRSQVKRLENAKNNRVKEQIDELIDRVKWEQKYNLSYNWYSKLLSTIENSEINLTQKQQAEIKKLKVTHRVMSLANPVKKQSIDLHLTEESKTFNEEIEKPKSSILYKVTRKCIYALTAIIVITGIQGYSSKKEVSKENTEIEQEIQLDKVSQAFQNFTHNENINSNLTMNLQTTKKQTALNEFISDNNVELTEMLKEMPALNADYTIEEDAGIYLNLNNVEQNKSQPYYKEGTIKTNSGYVFVDKKGHQIICQDLDETCKLLKNPDYNYVGIRAINEFSYDEFGNFVDYEGLYLKNDVKLLDGEETLYQELESSGKIRTLKKY